MDLQNSNESGTGSALGNTRFGREGLDLFFATQCTSEHFGYKQLQCSNEAYASTQDQPYFNDTIDHMNFSPRHPPGPTSLARDASPALSSNGAVFACTYVPSLRLLCPAKLFHRTTPRTRPDRSLTATGARTGTPIGRPPLAESSSQASVNARAAFRAAMLYESCSNTGEPTPWS